jgi:hypothetical protein
MASYKVEQMGNVSELLWGVLFGSVGLGFFVYGKKQTLIVPLVCGLTLMVYPYFMPNAVWSILIKQPFRGRHPCLRVHFLFSQGNGWTSIS